MFHDIKEVMDGTMNYVKLVSLQVRLPTFWNDIIEDFFGLVLKCWQSYLQRDKFDILP
jgi:hypothetical protein